MNIIQSMIHEKLGEVRIIPSEDGNPMNTLFCALDITSVLDYRNGRDAISRHCNGVVKIDATDSMGRVQSMSFIPLSDVFRLITRSNKPEAIEFQDWISNDVLPSLYQFGTYTIQDHINNPQFTNPEFNTSNMDSYKNDINDYHKPDEELKKKLRIADNSISDDDMRLLYGMGLIVNDMINAQTKVLYAEINNLKNQVTQLTQQNNNLIVPATIISKEEK